MDPQDAVLRWHRWNASGDPEALKRFIVTLDDNLPVGWRRLRGDELRPYQSLVREHSAGYAFSTAEVLDSIVLSLAPRGASEFRGGRVWFSGQRHTSSRPNTAVLWDEVIRFLEQGVTVAARKANAQLLAPTPEQIFFAELPVEVRGSLKAFSDASRKSLPLPEDEIDLWHAFVLSAFRSRTAVEVRAFNQWLVSEGWPHETAKELVIRFFDQCMLLSKFADTVSVA